MLPEPLPTASLADELGELRNDFVDRLWRAMLVVALVGLPISLLRAKVTGWLPLYGLHIALALGVLAVVLARGRLSTGTKSVLFICLLWAIGLPGILTLGFAAGGVLWLVMSGLAASTLFSLRAGVVVGLATALAMVGSAIAFIRGWVVLEVDMNAYLTEPAGWASLILVNAAFVGLVLYAFGAYARSTTRLMQRVKQQADQIAFLSLHDELTGLPQARLLGDRLDIALPTARRARHHAAVLGIDLDEFKEINDRHGHAAGDAVLQAVAARMRACLRPEDTLARTGGDEFVAVLAGLGAPVDAETVARKLIDAATTPVQFEGRSLRVGASVGIALFPDHGEDAESLLRAADAAMYAAKRAGGCGFAFAGAAG